MKTPVEVWLAVAAVGGRLSIAGDKVRMLLPTGCHLELKDAIRQHKASLLELLRLTFWVVRSDALAATVLWTPDEATKETLIVAGADPGCIYSAVELQQLVRRRVSAQELALIHMAKRRFSGKLTGP